MPQSFIDKIYEEQFNQWKPKVRMCAIADLITCEYGWVKLNPPFTVYDEQGRITGFSTRITDSKGRDETLEPVVRIVYD